MTGTIPHRSLGLALLAWLLFFPFLARAEQINDAALGLSLTIPEGFAPHAATLAKDPAYAYAYRRDTTDGKPGTLVIVERLSGVLPPTRLKASQLPAGFKGRLIAFNWNGLEIDGLEIPEVVGGIETVTYNVQVPTAPRAIQLKVNGPRDAQRSVQQLTETLLAGLTGQTNWTRPAAPAASAGVSNLGLWAAIGGGIALVLILGGFVAWKMTAPAKG